MISDLPFTRHDAHIPEVLLDLDDRQNPQKLPLGSFGAIWLPAKGTGFVRRVSVSVVETGFVRHVFAVDGGFVRRILRSRFM
jgi:hypothetical protein